MYFLKESFSKTDFWVRHNPFIDKLLLREKNNISLKIKQQKKFNTSLQKINIKFTKKYFIFLKENINNFCKWRYISLIPNLSEEFIRTFQNKVIWSSISIKNCVISEAFIEEFKEKINFSFLGSQFQLSENFIRKYKDKLNINKIFRYQILSEELILELINFKNNKNIKIEYIFKNKRFNSNLDFPYYTNVNYNKLKTNFRPTIFSNEFLYSICNLFFNINKSSLLLTNTISKYKYLSESLIDKYKNILNWSFICRYQNLSKEFIYKHRDFIIWKELKRNKVSKDVLTKEIQRLIIFETSI